MVDEKAKVNTDIVQATREQVNHPDHYQLSGELEVIDIIESAGLNFSLGNVIKYTLRAGKKGRGNAATIEDLRKAQWYLEREIARLRPVNITIG